MSVSLIKTCKKEEASQMNAYVAIHPAFSGVYISGGSAFCTCIYPRGIYQISLHCEIKEASFPCFHLTTLRVLYNIAYG